MKQRCRMPTVWGIIQQAGGLIGLRRQYVRIENPPYERLCIESIGTGPRGLDLISVAHYYEQEGDQMKDPDMTFEIQIEFAPEGGTPINAWFYPISFEQSPNIYWVHCWDQDGKLMAWNLSGAISFACTWDRNIHEQGFPQAFPEARKAQRTEAALKALSLTA